MAAFETPKAAEKVNNTGGTGFGPLACPTGTETTDLRSWSMLTAILAVRLDDKRSAEVDRALCDPDIFAAVVKAAERENVLPALHPALVGRFDATAKMWRAVAARAYSDNRERNLRIRRTALELGEAAAASHIRLVALKGASWVLEDQSDHAAWRWLIDCDVLVEAGHFAKMPALLRGLGYEPASQSKRHRNNFHHAPYWRANTLIPIEVHRHLGWRHELLAPEIVFANARPIANGILIPSPWCRALHAMIHWQIQDLGLSRSTVPLKELLEVARFLARDDVDWIKLAAHARRVGCIRACEAAVGLAAELLDAPIPEALRPGKSAERHAGRALVRRASPLRTWLATEMWRACTLWRCEKVAYRLALRGSPVPLTRIAVWAARIVRLPILMLRAVVILARGARLLRRRAEQPQSALPKRI
jgi:Uncharacterised nucleotidyltransferase